MFIRESSRVDCKALNINCNNKHGSRCEQHRNEVMPDFPQNTEIKKSGLPGILKLAFAITVILVASLATLLVMGSISKEVFYDYLITLLSIIAIGTVAAVIIAILSGPGKS